MIEQVIAAFIGTAAFAIIFSVPKKYIFSAGIVGAIGWFVYCLVIGVGWEIEIASFFAAAVVVFLARFCAVFFSCPSTTFIISGIFALVPGAKVYWTAYYLVRENPALAFENGFLAVRIAFCIVLGIVVILELPEKVFHVARYIHKK